MIGKLTGTLLDKSPPQVLVDCSGVGYEVDVPMSTFYNLPALGEQVTLLTHFVVREDAQLLFGFATAQERAAFRQLIKISGVGARTALSILSGLSVDDLAQAVAAQESGRLIKVPGIGKKPPNGCCWSLKTNSRPLCPQRARACCSTMRSLIFCRHWSHWATASEKPRWR